MKSIRWLLLACLSCGFALPWLSAAPTVEELQAQVTKLEEENAALQKEIATLKQALGAVVLVNINTASRPELEKVPGIGRTLAERIIAGRPYKSVDELDKIEGMGAKTLEKARPHLTAGE